MIHIGKKESCPQHRANATNDLSALVTASLRRPAFADRASALWPMHLITDKSLETVL
jgi:hypothetical protein